MRRYDFNRRGVTIVIFALGGSAHRAWLGRRRRRWRCYHLKKRSGHRYKCIGPTIRVVPVENTFAYSHEEAPYKILLFPSGYFDIFMCNEFSSPFSKKTFRPFRVIDIEVEIGVPCQIFFGNRFFQCETCDAFKEIGMLINLEMSCGVAI